MKVCLTAAMEPRGAQGHDDAILIDDNNNGNSDSERGSNEIDMVDSKKDLYFVITIGRGQGGTVTEG